MADWQASNARLHLPEIIDSAVAGEPQFVRRRDGKEVVVVSRDYYESTKPNLKTFLLEQGYSGEGEDAFDEILREVRAGAPDLLTRRQSGEPD
jgi:PHD/YefM family antitoxin component YafN of YafNO toxin-antitoxin module